MTRSFVCTARDWNGKIKATVVAAADAAEAQRVARDVLYRTHRGFIVARWIRVQDVTPAVPSAQPPQSLPLDMQRGSYFRREREFKREREWSCVRCYGPLRIVPGATGDLETGHVPTYCPSCEEE